MFKKTLLGAAIAAIAATSAAQADSFVDDSSLKLTYKNYYWNENGHDLPANSNGYERKEWAHAVVADYKSGYFADMIGVDFSMAYAELINGDEHNSITSLPMGDSGKAGEIGTVTVAYLKGKYEFSDNVSVNGGYGAKKRGRKTYGDSGSRILHASSYGTDVDFNVYGADLYATQITRFGARNSAQYAENMTGNNGEKVDYVNIFGAAYEFENGLALAAEQANSDDYMKKSFLQADYSIALQNDMSLDLNARYGKVKEDGDKYANDGYDSKYYNLNATLNFGNAYVGLGYNKTKDGDYDNSLFAEDNGTFNSSLDMWEGYNMEDTSAYLLSAGYDFSDMVPGLSADVWYAKGTNAKDVANYSQREIGTYINYAFSGALDGLNLAYLHTTYRASGQATGTRTSTGQIYDEDVNRIYITYTYEVF